MSKNYTQLSLVRSYHIEAFIKAGMKQKMIVWELGVNPSTFLGNKVGILRREAIQLDCIVLIEAKLKRKRDIMITLNC